MMNKPTVFIVDSDTEYCQYIARQLAGHNLYCKTFSNASSFLEQYSIYQIGCLLSDLKLPGISGLKLQQTLCRNPNHLPIVFATQNADIRTAVIAIQQGAHNFLEKPIDAGELAAILHEALDIDRINHRRREQQATIRARLDNLTRREREVLTLIVDKNTNRSIAEQLGVSIKTIEFHRSRVMQKMHADSLLDLVEMIRVDSHYLPAESLSALKSSCEADTIKSTAMPTAYA